MEKDNLLEYFVFKELEVQIHHDSLNTKREGIYLLIDIISSCNRSQFVQFKSYQLLRKLLRSEGEISFVFTCFHDKRMDLEEIYNRLLGQSDSKSLVLLNEFIGLMVDMIKYSEEDNELFEFEDQLKSLLFKISWTNPIEHNEHFHTIHQLFNMKVVKFHNILCKRLIEKGDITISDVLSLFTIHKDFTDVFFVNWQYDENNSFTTENGLAFGGSKLEYLVVRLLIHDFLSSIRHIEESNENTLLKIILEWDLGLY